MHAVNVDAINSIQDSGGLVLPCWATAFNLKFCTFYSIQCWLHPQNDPPTRSWNPKHERLCLILGFQLHKNPPYLGQWVWVFGRWVQVDPYPYPPHPYLATHVGFWFSCCSYIYAAHGLNIIDFNNPNQKDWWKIVYKAKDGLHEDSSWSLKDCWESFRDDLVSWRSCTCLWKDVWS